MAKSFEELRKEMREKYGGTSSHKEEPKTTSGNSETASRFHELRRELTEKHNPYANVSTDFVNKFISDANSFMKTDDKSAYRTWNSLGLGSRLDTFRGWLRHNRGAFDEESYKSLNDTVYTLTKLRDYYGKFETEDDYTRSSIGWLDRGAEKTADTVAGRQEYYKGNQDRIDEINEELPWYANTWLPNWIEDIFLSKENEGIRDEAEALKADNLKYDRTQGVTDKYYTPVTEEFKQNAAYRDYANASMEELQAADDVVRTIRGKNLGYDYDGNMVDNTGKIVYPADHPVVKAMRENDLGWHSNSVLKDKDVGYYDTLVQDKLGMYLSASQEDLDGAYERLIAGGNADDTWAILLNEGETHAWKELTEGEIDIYYNLYKTQGQAAAYQYLDDMEGELTYRATQKRAEEISNAGLLKQLAMNMASVPMNALGGVVGLVGDVADAIKGQAYNPYSAAHSWSNDASAIRTDTAADINKATGNIALPWVGTTFGDVYQSIMSFGDSVMASYIPGGAALLGTNAATMEMKDLYERGASTEQLLAGGFLAGAAEMFFEKVSIGELNKIKNMDLKDAKNFVDVLVRGTIMGGVEASEEMATEIANTITDAIVMGSQSDWVDLETFAKNVVNAGIGGFISGGFGGSIAAAANHAQYNAMAEEHGQDIIDRGGQESIDALKQLALEMYSDKSGVDALRGVKAVNKVADKATAKNVGRLSYQMESTVHTQNRTDMEKALVDKGPNKREATLVSAYLTDSSEITPQQVTEIENNERFQTAIDAVLGDSELNISSDPMALTLARMGVQPKKQAKAPTERSEAAAQQPQATSVTENAPVEQTAAESEFSVSETGKTTYNGAEVKVAGVSRVENGEVIVRLDNGEEANARDVEFANEDEALLYEAAANMDIDTANDFIQGFTSMKNASVATRQSVSDYMVGFNEARTYGELGIPYEAIARDGKYANALVGNQAQIAYNRGKINGINRAKVAQAARTGSTNARKSYKGETHVSKTKSSKAYKELSDTQKAGVDGMVSVYKALGIDVYFFESPTNVYGKRTGKNGYFNPEDGSVHIDLYAGLDGKGTILFTAGHELTHYIREKLPEKFKTFADALFEQYEANGVSVAGLIAAKKDSLKKLGRITPEMTEEQANDLAYEETVADACEAMLKDGEAFAQIAEKVKAKDTGLWNAIKKFFADLVARIKAAYANLDPDSYAGQKVAEMLETAKDLQSMWVDMLVEASEVSDMVEIDASTESVAPTMFSERTWTASEYVTNRDQMAEKIANALGVSLQKAKGYIDDINSIAKMIADDRVRLDYEASSFGSAFVSNVEYGGSFDYTTLCKKRRIYTGTFTEIQKRLHDVALSPDDILKIRNLMIEEGIEATCGLCYVEGSRANMGKFAKEFIRLYKRDNPLAWIPNMADVNTPDGVEQMRISHPEAYEQYVYFWNHYGKLKDSDPALFASQQKPKLYEARKEYKGEILEHFKGDSTVAKKNRNGGIRMQSFSDFEIVHLIDTMQVIMDMSTVGLAGQAYTKVPEFARAFGETGLKINLSLIAKGVDADGNLIFDDREGMPHETAFALRDKHSKNVGTIIVTFTDEQLLAAMADPRIDFIIPFHRSQWKKGQYGAMGLPKGTKDYTFMQNEKLIKQTYHEYRGKMVKDKASNYMPNEYWDFSKSGKENAEAYLKMCAENNKRPKFYKLLDYDGKGTYSLKADGSTDGYWKLLIDFKMYDNDGVGSPQMAVTPTFSMDEAMAMLDEYQGGHSKYPVASSVVDTFVSEYNESNGTKYSDRDGNVKDATELSEKDLEYLLEKAQYGELHDKSYIPLRRNTPEFFIGVVQEHSKGAYFIENYPMAATVEHLKQNMEEEDGLSYGEERPHGFSVGDIITISRKMGDPSYIVLQENGRYAEVVSFYNKRNKKVIVAIDFANPNTVPQKNYKHAQYMNGYGAGCYNIVVTQYEADDLRGYLGKNEVVYDKTKMNGKYQVGSGRIVTVTHDTPFIEDIISQDSDSVKRKFSDRDSSYAPPFYSHMGKVIDGIRLEKMGAGGVVSYLKGKGVKDEEIKWSGIEAFLEGKKSVTKAELQAFVAGSQLQIVEQTSNAATFVDEDGNTYTDSEFKEKAYAMADEQGIDRDRVKFVLDPDDGTFVAYAGSRFSGVILEADGLGSMTRWSEYKLDGGSNYRELVFQMPNSTFSNQAMRAHWGDDAEGVLAHARIQDMTTSDGKKMLFIEEIQSDWHNEGAKDGYAESKDEVRIEGLKAKAEEAFFKVEDYSTEMTGNAGEWETIEKTAKGAKLLREYREAQDAYDNSMNDFVKKIPDAPFRTTYHEYVLKRLLRMAAEEGYDSIGWTPAEIQSKRWSEVYAEGYRIEYDQDIPSFLKKYGKKWGAQVGKTKIPSLNPSETYYDVNRMEEYKSFPVWQDMVRDELDAQGVDVRKVLFNIVDDGYWIAYDKVSGMEYDRAEIRKTSGSVWSMSIPDSMKDSVLYEGQVLYSEREIQPITETEYKDLEKHFGTTGSFRVAGYLLTDGKLLDFSGKHWGDSTSRTRQVDHRDVQEVLGNRGSDNGVNAMVDMIGNGNIRLMPEDGGINLAVYPNEKQRRVLSVYINYMLNTEGQVIIDYDAVGGDTVYSREYGKTATSRQILNDIRNYFNGARQSDLMRFHTMDSDRDPDSISNRSLLANALESVAQNDIERNKLQEYKSKIALIESEQAKLAEVKKKANDIRFTKGRTADETKRMRELEFEANQIANRINTYDRQLLTLESTAALKGVLEREKKLAYQRAERKGKEALARQREKAAETQRELLTRYQESRKKGVEGRRKTEMRHKIKDITSELDTLLRRPTAKKHIKEELRAEVADALLAINMDTVGADERVARYNEMIARAKDPDIIAELTRTRDRIQLQGDNLKEKFAALQTAYEKIKASDDVELSMSYQEVIRNSIKNVTDKVGNTSIRNMSLEQLEMVYDLFSMIRKTIRNANKAFNEQKGLTIMQMAEAVNDQVRTVGGQAYKRSAVVAALQREGWSLLKPYVAFRTIGSVTLTNLYKGLRAGEDTFYGDVKEAQEFIEEQYKKHGYKSWDMKKTKTFTAKSGKTFDLTLEQMMTLYAYSRRDQAHKHIIEGGIVFEDAMIVEKNKAGIPIKYEVTTKDAFNLSEETFAEIANSLSAEQKAFVDAMQAYLSDVMGAKGNDVSMELLGVKLFKEKFYLPIKSSQEYRNFSAEEAGEVKLKSPAFSKETVQHANNPIVLHNFTDLWAEHINDMSMYHSFVLALEDFTRVYNYKTKTDAKLETMSTKATLDTAFPGATKYINKFLKDMNGGVRAETVGWAEKLTSLAKKGSVLGSASVAIQQPSAVMRAMAMVNPKYFVTTAHNSINLVKHKQDWEELKKYAPIAGIKEMGRFDVGMGQGTVDWIKSNKTLMNKAEDILSAAPALMDEITWVTIWNAVKRETVHTRKDLRPGSDEFLKVAGERFTDVISTSQVYDSVFSRSDLMRNKSWIAKATTAFMAEPSTTLNMLFDAYIQGKRTGSAKGFLKTTAAASGAVMASIIVNAALKAIVTAARDDDEDESYSEKYLEHFVGDLKDSLNPLTLVPVAKDVVSIFQGYDVERMDMALFSDLNKAVEAFDSDSKTMYEKWSGLIGAASAFFGIPVKNVERDIRAAINVFFGKRESTTKQGLLDAISEGWKGESKSNGQQLYEAMVGGDSAQIERVNGRFKDDKAITSAIRTALRENDSRIHEAAVARYNGNIAGYTRIAKAIIAEGNFKQDDVVAAINAEINALKKDDGKDETSTTAYNKATSIYKMDDYYTAIIGRDQASAYAVKEDIIKTDIANGKDREEAEDDFNGRFASHLREQYEAGNIADREAINMLVNYGGKTDEDAESKVQYWAFKKRYPDYELSEEAVAKYYSEVEPTGINVKVYYDYSKQRAKCKGTDLNGDGKTDSGSVKKAVLEVIDNLPITYEQKDVLYYLNGWSASTIGEAPWH